MFETAARAAHAPSHSHSKHQTLTLQMDKFQLFFKAFSGNTVNLGEKFKIDFCMRYFISGSSDRIFGVVFGIVYLLLGPSS